MLILKQTDEIRVGSEVEAKELMEKVRLDSQEKGYMINKSGYTYKSKKAKGEIVAECYIVKIEKIYNEVWDD